MMQQMTVTLSPVKDGRRVLGEKTTNASMSPSRKQRCVDSAVTADIPLKPSRELPPPRKTSLLRCHAGQKRTIDEVEDTNNSDLQTRLFAGPRQQYEEERDTYTQNTQSAMDSEDHIRTTREATEAATEATEPITEPEGEDRQQPHREPSQERLSISSILNESPRHVPAPETTVPVDPEARRLFIQQKAVLLRNRIQAAMRHVKDRQFDRRVSELEAHSRKFPRLSVSSKTTRDPVEQPVSAPSPKRAKLLPAPELKPTPYSARPVPDMPSSPSSTGNEFQDNEKTPTQENPRGQPSTPGSPVQLSSPPGTVTRANDDRNKAEPGGRANEVDKMVVAAQQKGDAVNGLLKLMKTTDKYDSLDTWTG